MLTIYTTSGHTCGESWGSSLGCVCILPRGSGSVRYSWLGGLLGRWRWTVWSSVYPIVKVILCILFPSLGDYLLETLTAGNRVSLIVTCGGSDNCISMIDDRPGCCCCQLTLFLKSAFQFQQTAVFGRGSGYFHAKYNISDWVSEATFRFFFLP